MLRTFYVYREIKNTDEKIFKHFHIYNGHLFLSVNDVFEGGTIIELDFDLAKMRLHDIPLKEAIQLVEDEGWRWVK